MSVTLIPDLYAHDAVLGSSLTPDSEGADRRIRSARFGVLSAVSGSPQPVGIDTGDALSLPIDTKTHWVERCVAVLDKFADVDATLVAASSELHTRGGLLLAHGALDRQFDPVRDYRSRLDRWSSLFIGLLGAVIAFMFLHFRGSESAAYRLSGTSYWGLVRIHILEQWIIAGAFLASVAMSTIVMREQLVSPPGALVSGFLGSLVWMLSFGTLASFFSRRDVLSQAKDR